MTKSLWPFAILMVVFCAHSAPPTSDQLAQQIADQTKADLLESFMSRQLDPDAVKVRNVKLSSFTFLPKDGGKTAGICGEALVKNQYGAYTGWRAFTTMHNANGDVIVTLEGDPIRGAAHQGFMAMLRCK